MLTAKLPPGQFACPVKRMQFTFDLVLPGGSAGSARSLFRSRRARVYAISAMPASAGARPLNNMQRRARRRYD